MARGDVSDEEWIIEELLPAEREEVSPRPQEYGPHTTIYNRFNRWSRKRFWTGMLEALAAAGAVTKSSSIDSTYVKAQRSAFGGKGGRGRKGSARRAAARPASSTSSPM